LDKSICKELRDIIEVQLSDNVKARVLDNNLSNSYVTSDNGEEVRSQIKTHRYLFEKSAKKKEELSTEVA